MPELADPRHKYRQIADYYEALIDSGTIGPGAKLPSVDEIARTWNVARNTAGGAIRELQRRQLVHSEHGRGTFAA